MTLNLISGAWIPVRRRDGTRIVIRPAQIVEELAANPNLFPDWPRPDLNIATLELLIGLISVAMPPEDDDDWLEIWRRPPSVADLDKAFAPYEAAFNLDGDGPRFCQDFDELEGDAGPIEGLFIDAAGESTIKKNIDLMVKRERYETVSRASAAIALYALQQFAPSGGAGHRTSMRGGGPLTTLALPPTVDDKSPSKEQPPSLWHLIWANVREHQDGAVADSDMAKVFPWLAKTNTSNNNEEIHEEATDKVHPCQAFFGMPRRIRLSFASNTDQHSCDLTGQPDEQIVTGYVTRPYGVNYGQWRHPLTPYYCKKKGDTAYFATHPTAGRVGYRNWVAIVLGSKEKTREPAMALRKFRERQRGAPGVFGGLQSKTLIAGWAMSNMKPLDFIIAEQPLYLIADEKAQEAFDGFARKMVLGAESVAKSMIGAIQAALKAGGNKPGSDSALITSAREGFFAGTEIDFHDILGKTLEKADAGEGWQQPFAEDWLKHLQRAALAGFDVVVQLDPTDFKRAGIVVKARKKLKGAAFGNALRKELGLPVSSKSNDKPKGATS